MSQSLGAGFRLDAALHPHMVARREGSHLLGIAGRPFADVQIIPPRNVGHLGQLVYIIAGRHCGLYGKGAGGSDHQATQGGDQNFFLFLVHLELSLKSDFNFTDRELVTLALNRP